MNDNPWKKQMMNNQNSSAQQSAPKPPEPAPSSESVNPWKLKAQQNQVHPTPPTNTTSTGPSWMKQPQQQPVSTPVSDNPWKKASGFGASKIQGMKQKKDREEKERLQKENEEKLRKQQQRLQQQRLENQQLQRERLERQRLQQERLERERQQQQRIRVEQLKAKEIKAQARENKSMELEQAISIERQNQDKQDQQARQKKSKKPIQQTPKTKSSQISQIASPRSRSNMLFSSEKKPPSNNHSLAMQYLSSFHNLFAKFETYREKLDCQKQLIKVYAQFRNHSSRRLKQLIDGQSQRKMKVVDEDTLYQLAMGTSKIENGKTLYDMTAIKKLKRKMQLYDLLQNSVLGIMKKIGVFRLRLPMITLMEYRGVACMAMALTPEQLDSLPLQVGKIRQIANDLELLQKDMKKVCPRFNLSMLQCRKVTYNLDTQVFILYVKEQAATVISPKPALRKQHLQTIDWLTSPQTKTFSTSTENLKKLDHLGNSKELIDCLLLAKTVNSIYRSCQGEVEELHLFNLVISHDEGIWQLIRQIGNVEQLPQRGVLLKLFELYSGVKFDYDERAFEVGLLGIKQLKVKEYYYSLQKLEFREITNNYDKYLKDEKLQLAGESILLRYELAEIGQTQQEKVNLVLDHVQLLLLQQKNEEAIEELLKIGEEIELWEPTRIRHLSLLFKTYSLLNQQTELLQTFETLLKEINFTLGPDNHMHVYLYSVLAYFYSSKRFTESINLYQLALSVAVKLYGAASEQAGDIYMDIAKTHIKHNNLDDATHHLEQAIKIYADNKSKTAEILAIMSRVLFLKGDRKEALEKIDRAIKISQKLDRSNELFEMYKFKMSYLQDSPESKYKIIDAMLELGMTRNIRPITKKAFELALKEELPRVPRSRRDRLLEISTDEYANSQLLPGSEFELHRKNFPSVCELIRWAFGLLDPSGGQVAVEKAELIFSEMLSYFQQDQLQRILQTS